MTSPAVVAPQGAALDLRLFLRCHDHLLSVSAGGIERILLADEVEAPEPGRTTGDDVPQGCVGVLRTGNVSWAAWDLAVLLGLAPVRTAWLLLQRRHREEMVRLAVRSDRCLHVGRFSGTVPLLLPPGLAHDRVGLVRAAFAAGFLRLRQQGDAPVGLDLDLDRLWSPAELDFSRDLLRADPIPEGEDGA